MLVLDIVLRLLVIEEKTDQGLASDSDSDSDSDLVSNKSSSWFPDEESPLVHRSPSSNGSQDSLLLRNFFHPRLIIAVLTEVTVSSVFTAFETVRSSSWFFFFFFFPLC